MHCVARIMRLYMILFLFTIVGAKRKAKHRRKILEPQDEPKFGGEGYAYPVVFGHIYREGVGDFPNGLKQPIDLLELSMPVRNLTEIPIESRDTAEQNAPEAKKPKRMKPKVFTNPRDEYLYLKSLKDDKVEKKEGPMWFDFENMLYNNVNAQKSTSNTGISSTVESDKRFRKTSYNEPKKEYFSSNSFDLMPDYSTTNMNWTTCDQFKFNTHFHPKDIVNIDWIPFYVWTIEPHVTAFVHRFSIPTKKIVAEYKEAYGPLLDKKIDWEQPKLLMKEEFEALLIAADRRGTFDVIQRHALSKNIKKSATKLPVITLRFIIVDPYLALTYCDNYYATIMAIAGDEPTDNEEKRTEAARLNFRGFGYPISRDVETEKRKAEAEKQWKLNEENKKFIQLSDDFTIEKDRYRNIYAI